MASGLLTLEFRRAAALLAADLPLAAMERLAACGAIARAAEDLPASLWVAGATARGYAMLEQPGRGVRTIQDAQAAALAAASPRALRLAVAVTLAQLHLTLRLPERASAICAEALSGPEARGAADLRDLPAVADPALSVARLHLLRAEAEAALSAWPAAARAALEAGSAMDEVGDESGVAAALFTVGRAEAALGQHDAAATHLRAALKRDAAAGRPRAEARDQAALAGLAQRRGETADAMMHGSAALDILWSRVGRLDRWEVADLCQLFGTILAETGDRQLAIQCLSRAAAYYGQTGDHAAGRSASAALDAVLRESGSPRGSAAPLPEYLRARVRALTTMLGLLDDLASTDPHLERHASVVTGYALKLAAAMDLGEAHIAALVHACRLYHLGQSAGGDGPTHPVLGAELLRAFPLPPETLAAVRHFRERWDGGGYPAGLGGQEIPTVARLLAVVDGYVSLALDPAEPLPHSGALALVRARSGTAYDPDVVQAFAQLHDAVRPD